MRPVLDPKRDLVGATPEALARALFRRTDPYSAPRARTQSIVRDEVPVKQVPPDHPGDDLPHLRNGS